MNQDFLRSSSSGIAQEIQKYRMLKSQGTFETLTADQSDVSTMFSPSNSRFRMEEKRPSQSSLQTKSALRYINKAIHHAVHDKAQSNHIINDIANKQKTVVEKSKTNNDTATKAISRATSANKSVNRTPAKTERTPVKSNARPASTARSNVSTAERTPRTNNSNSKTNVETTKFDESPVGKLKKEVREWRDFGESMAKSYESLSVKYKKFLKEKEHTNATIASLNEQLANFKDVSFRNQTDGASVSLESLEFRKSTEFSMRERVAELENQNQNYKMTIEFLKDENEVQKRALIEAKKQHEETEYYKKLAEVKFKECSTLAEEIICLRTDLDRSHSNFLKMLKAQDLLKKKVGSPKKSESLRTSVRKAVSWKDDVESPKPKELKIVAQK